MVKTLPKAVLTPDRAAIAPPRTTLRYRPCCLHAATFENKRILISHINLHSMIFMCIEYLLYYVHCIAYSLLHCLHTIIIGYAPRDTFAVVVVVALKTARKSIF